MSLEIPEAIAEYTIKFCRRNGTEVILKPSAVEKIKEGLLKDIAYFVPNENEMHTFVPGEMSLEEKAQILLDKGVENVIVTLGEKGCYLRNRDCSMYFEEGRDLVYSIGFAIYASGISVTRHGVQPALPDRKTVEIYEEEIYERYHIK